ncbi:uncharacterized protein LOC142575345 isoform X2 [Dermacentor variabilis]|uniref:uncharacterized protein LOC142575345 isoform X2 n=1 Tax=Dermacentor variabilis TaxID=34621 RepID=UPI003F5B3F23
MQGKLPRARSVKCASSEFSAFVRLTKVVLRICKCTGCPLWESLELKPQHQAQQHNTIAAQPTWQVAADMPSGGQKSSRTTLWN